MKNLHTILGSSRWSFSHTNQHEEASRPSKMATTAGAVVLMMIPTVASADDNWEPTNYEQRFEAPKKGVRLKDNNVWVYKRSFAERFGMPERWIDDDLEGAEAVAYRVEWSNIRKCGFFSEPDNCRTIERCILDVYLSDSVSKNLPWKNNDARDFIRYDSSTRFLTIQNLKDASTWDPEKIRWDISRANIGVDSISWVSGTPREGKVYSASSSAVSVLAYDRKIFEGLDYIKLAADCNIAGREDNVRIFFQDKFPDRDDFDVSYEELVEGTSDNAMEFLEYKQAWFQSKFKADVPHVVTLPDEYMGRVNEYDHRVYRPKGLATEVEKRLSGKHPDDPEEKRWWQRLFGL